jgi:ESCRT-II complex subunit VPS25
MSTSAAFAFPPHYAFPPFFSLQLIPLTKSSQLQSWSSFILSYCRHHRLFSLTLVDALESPLFFNKQLNKRLSARDAREILDWMASKEGGERIEWIGAGKSREPAEKCWIYWRRPEEWAGVVEAWIDATGQKNTVLTLYELTQGQATENQGGFPTCIDLFVDMLISPLEFHAMDAELFQKSMQVLIKRGKAQIFGQDDQQGIKFF